MKQLKDTMPAPPQEFHNNLVRTLNSLPEQEKENLTMKKRLSIKKTIAIAACTVMVLGITVFAAGQMIAMRSGSSWSKPTYTSLPSAERVEKDTGLNLTMPEQVGGYTFQSGHVITNKDQNAVGATVRKFKSVGYTYENGAEKVSVYVEPLFKDIDYSTLENATTLEYNGTDISYSNYTNKLVPGDYQLTEQDKADEQSGKYVFSYGSEEIEVSDVQTVAFNMDGMHYAIQAIDSVLTEDQLIGMAKELLDR